MSTPVQKSSMSFIFICNISFFYKLQIFLLLKLPVKIMHKIKVKQNHYFQLTLYNKNLLSGACLRNWSIFCADNVLDFSGMYPSDFLFKRAFSLTYCAISIFLLMFKV